MFPSRKHSSSGPGFIDPKETSSHDLYKDVGRSANRPFMILATITELSLGDLLCKVSFLSSLKDQFDHARLVVRYNDFRDYSAAALSLSPNIDEALGIRGETPRWLRPLLRDGRLWRPLASALSGSGRREEAFYDLMVIDSMMSSYNVHSFDPVTPLRVPVDQQSDLQRILIEKGLDPSQPFAVVHYRDGTYAPKSKNPVRNGDADAYRTMCDYIIDTLGCQVVRIGHAEMTPFPARSGFVDLSAIDKPFMLQAYAVSRARFMIAGASGPVALGWGFGTPTALVDCCESCTPYGSAENVVYTQELTTADGDKLRNNALLERGLFDIKRLTKTLSEKSGFSLRRNDAEELSAVALHLHTRTGDVNQWRSEAEPSKLERPNTVSWPRETVQKFNFLDV